MLGGALFLSKTHSILPMVTPGSWEPLVMGKGAAKRLPHMERPQSQGWLQEIDAEDRLP